MMASIYLIARFPVDPVDGGQSTFTHRVQLARVTRLFSFGESRNVCLNFKQRAYLLTGLKTL